ncbi:MAG TPA: hypothetical protein VL860_13715, partial [Planctomycetota bacterium]|nr:hypothetical protein [Planctomycetota bacterium]
MSESPATPPPSPGAGGSPPSVPPPPASAPAPAAPRDDHADTVAYPVSSGLTKFSKTGDREPKIDTAKRERVDQLWRFAMNENAPPGATLGSLATVPLQPGDPTLDWQHRLPKATIGGATGGVIVEDSSGKVVVHGGGSDAHPGDSLAGGTIDALAGGTLDAPPTAAAGQPPRDAMGNPSGGAISPHAPTLIGTHPTTRGTQALSRPGSTAGSTGQPISSTAPTLPGTPPSAPPAGPIKPSPASRVLSPRPEDFRIEAKLASGGMGDVYLATQLGLQRVVALKRPK